METGHLFPKLGQKPGIPPNMRPQPHISPHPWSSPPPMCVHTHTHTCTHRRTCTHVVTGLLPLLLQHQSLWLIRFSQPCPPHTQETGLWMPQLPPFPCHPPWCKPGLRLGGAGETRGWGWVELNLTFLQLMGCMTSRQVPWLLKLQIFHHKVGRRIVPSLGSCCKG